MKRGPRRLAFTHAAVLAVAGIVAMPEASAQRTEDNPTAKSEDAFGRSVGQESIGIYNPGDVRGFSTIDAGNVRIEGLYFDRQTDPNQRLVEGSSIRVGIAAQSYLFPSPTGISDYDLRRVGDDRVISPVITYGPFNGTGFEVDAKLPIVPERFGIAAGAGYYHDHFPYGGANRAWSMAVIPRWRPTDRIEVMPFYSRTYFDQEESEPLMITADGGLPPKIRRERYYGQPWSLNDGFTSTYGAIAEARLGQWITRVGAFESVFAPDLEFGELFLGIEDDGRSREVVVAFPDSRYASRSGELRVSRSFEESARRHTIYLAARGRNQVRRYGGEDVIDVGAVPLGEGRPIPKPDFNFAAQTHDEVKQETAGVAYELQWKQRGELSLGVQKTFYRKSIETPQGMLPESRAEPVLVNATATVYANPRLAIYASYTEGLEESPVAPDNAINRNAAAPALDTEQFDAGVRWTVVGDMKLIAGVFRIEKPYFDLDRNQFFGSLGTVEHKGVEISLGESHTAADLGYWRAVSRRGGQRACCRFWVDRQQARRQRQAVCDCQCELLDRGHRIFRRPDRREHFAPDCDYFERDRSAGAVGCSHWRAVQVPDVRQAGDGAGAVEQCVRSVWVGGCQQWDVCLQRAATVVRLCGDGFVRAGSLNRRAAGSARTSALLAARRLRASLLLRFLPKRFDIQHLIRRLPVFLVDLQAPAIKRLGFIEPPHLNQRIALPP